MQQGDMHVYCFCLTCRFGNPAVQYYAPSSSCSLNIWFITSTFLFFLFYGGISISPIRNESAGLFTSAAGERYQRRVVVGFRDHAVITTS
jgi:hypothetical protein